LVPIMIARAPRRTTRSSSFTAQSTSTIGIMATASRRLRFCEQYSWIQSLNTSAQALRAAPSAMRGIHSPQVGLSTSAWMPSLSISSRR